MRTTRNYERESEHVTSEYDTRSIVVDVT